MVMESNVVPVAKSSMLVSREAPAAKIRSSVGALGATPPSQLAPVDQLASGPCPVQIKVPAGGGVPCVKVTSMELAL